MKQRTLPDFFRRSAGIRLVLPGDGADVTLPRVTAFLNWWTREQSVEEQLGVLTGTRTLVERNKCKLFAKDFP